MADMLSIPFVPESQWQIQPLQPKVTSTALRVIQPAGALPVYELLGFKKMPLYGAVCDDPKLDFFQNAASWINQVMTALGSNTDSIVRTEKNVGELSGWQLYLQRALRQVNIDTGQEAEGRLAMIAEVSHGNHYMTAVGLGCNKKQMVRASNLALAYTAVRYMAPQDLGQLSPDLRALSDIQAHRVMIRGVGAQMPQPMGVTTLALIPAGGTGAQVAPSETLVPMPFSNPNLRRRTEVRVDSVPRSSPGSPEDIQEQVRSAKSHLCAFRKLIPNLTDAQQEAVQLLLKDTPLKVMSFEHASAFGYHSWVLGKLKQVFDDDRWKTTHCGVQDGLAPPGSRAGQRCADALPKLLWCAHWRLGAGLANLEPEEG